MLYLLLSTNTFSDIANKQLDGANPFTEKGVRITGKSDDEVLNRGVARFSAVPAAERRLCIDCEMTGRIRLSTVTKQARNDPMALKDRYRAMVK